jgi:hypothetical protein
MTTGHTQARTSLASGPGADRPAQAKPAQAERRGKRSSHPSPAGPVPEPRNSQLPGPRCPSCGDQGRSWAALWPGARSRYGRSRPKRARCVIFRYEA